MDKPRRLRPWIVAALIGLPVLYVGSFGPACWLSAYPFGGCEGPLSSTPRKMIVYWPLGRFADESNAIHRGLQWWATLGMRDNHFIWVPSDQDRQTFHTFAKVP